MPSYQSRVLARSGATSRSPRFVAYSALKRGTSWPEAEQVASCNLPQTARSRVQAVIGPAPGGSDDREMVASSVRTDIRVVRFIRRLEPRSASIAVVVRATGSFCEKSGLTRPSYEQIRLLVHEARDRRERRRAAIDLLVDVDLRRRPPEDLLYLLDDPRRAPRARIRRRWQP